MMLQRTDKTPAPQFTPAQIMALNGMFRVSSPRGYGPKPARGFPKNFRPVWFGQFEDLLHHRPVGFLQEGTARVERVTYKSPVIAMVDTRKPKGRAPFNKAREMARRRGE